MRNWFVLSVGLSVLAACAPPLQNSQNLPAGPGGYKMRLSDTAAYGSSSFEISSADGNKREVFLSAFLSPLGSELRSREPSMIELREIRAACQHMRDLVVDAGKREFDDYFVELADGKAPLETIHPSKRTVFGFTRELGCGGQYDKIEVD